MADEDYTLTRFVRRLRQSFLRVTTVKAAPEHDLQKLARRLSPPDPPEDREVRSIIAPDPVYLSPRVNPAPRPAAADSPSAALGDSAPEESDPPDDRPPKRTRRGRVRTPLFAAFNKIAEKPEGWVLIASRDVRRIIEVVRKTPGYGGLEMKDQTVRDAITAWLERHPAPKSLPIRI